MKTIQNVSFLNLNISVLRQKRVLNKILCFFSQRPSTMRSENLARVFWQDFRRLHKTLEVSAAT